MMTARSQQRLIDRLPAVRGRLTENAPLAPVTWFRVGGPAEVMFRPLDVEDLATFLAGKPADVPVTVIGVASNLLVRDGGVEGVVVRLGRGFTAVEISGTTVEAGAAALDLNVALAARDAQLGGLEFLSGVPGTIGGALRMNAGAYGSEIKDVLLSAAALDAVGKLRALTPAEMRLTYRHCGVREDWIFVGATLAGVAADADRDPAAHGGDPARARGEPAHSRAHRRLDLRQSVRSQGLGAHRSCRLPRPRARRRDGVGKAHQFPDQHRHCHGG